MRDTAQEITDLVVAQLEQGVAPWRRPWSVNGLEPTSLQTGKTYRGINALLLSMFLNAGGYDRNLWVTYRQAEALGGNVRKGERGYPVVFWKKVQGDDVEGEKVGKSFMIMKSFTVFNVAQCESLTLPEKYATPAFTWEGNDESVQAILAGYTDAPKLKHKAQAQAFYVPGTDTVTMPPREAFPTVEDYAETLFHEMTHSTGHKSRLDRFTDTDEPAVFGSESYAREELVAELGAMMLLSRAGLQADVTNNAAYIGGWLKRLQDDKRLIIQAAQRADKAVAWITKSAEGEA